MTASLPAALAAYAEAGRTVPYVLLADRDDGCVVRCGEVVAKAHAGDSDRDGLSVRVRIAGDRSLAGVLLPPLRAGVDHVQGRPVSLWPYGEPVDPKRPEDAPWEAAARLLAALHQVPLHCLPGPIPPMRGPAKLARALHRLATAPGLTRPGSADGSGVLDLARPGPADRAAALGLTRSGPAVGAEAPGFTRPVPADGSGVLDLARPGSADGAAALGLTRSGPADRARRAGLAFPGPGPRQADLAAAAPADAHGLGRGRARGEAPAAPPSGGSPVEAGPVGRAAEAAHPSGAGPAAGYPTPADADAVRAAARTLPAWARGEAAPPVGGVLCHGDLHLGQLVRFPAPEGTWRLIDVDDLGIGTPAWDLARPAAWYAAGILDPGTWLRFLDAYRAAGGPAAGPPGSDPWPELDVAARALTVQTAALALAKAAAERRRLDDVERLMMEACTRIATLPPDLEPGAAS